MDITITDAHGTQTHSAGAAQLEIITSNGGLYRTTRSSDGIVRLENATTRQAAVIIDLLAKPPHLYVNELNAAYVDTGKAAAAAAAAKAKKTSAKAAAPAEEAAAALPHVELKKSKKKKTKAKPEAAAAHTEEQEVAAAAVKQALPSASANNKKPLTEAQRAAKNARAKERRDKAREAKEKQAAAEAETAA